MSSNVKHGGKIEGAVPLSLNRHAILILLVLLALLIGGALSLRSIEAGRGQAGGVGLTLGQQAEAARLTGLAGYYADREGARMRALEADSARLSALAQWYADQEAARVRARQAEAARLTALAEYYLVQGK